MIIKSDTGADTQWGQIMIFKVANWCVLGIKQGEFKHSDNDEAIIVKEPSSGSVIYKQEKCYQEFR